VGSDVADFSGFYAGVNLGGRVGGQDDVHTVGQAAPNIANIAGGARPGLVRLDRKGILGGGQFGYNYQAGRVVAGLETDFDGIDADDTNTVVTKQLNTGLPLNNTFRSDLQYLGTFRGRLGIVFHRALFYGTGGLAYGETRQRVDMFGPTGGVVQFHGDRSQIQTGYAAGGGVEYPLSRNISVKAEYLYYDLGKETLNVAVIPGSGGAGTGYNSQFRNDGHVVRIGVNYAFR
jgi:outer membrane immunogenic protein